MASDLLDRLANAETELRCADCGELITTQDALADSVVEDDEGLHHAECYGWEAM